MMPPGPMLLGVAGALLLVSVAGQPGWAEQPKPPAGGVRPGMSQKQVLEQLGKPKQIARQILYRHYLEQWVYDGPQAVRIEFDCVRGREPTVQSLTPLRP